MTTKKETPVVNRAIKFKPQLPDERPKPLPKRVEGIRSNYYRQPNGYITAAYGRETVQAKTKMNSGWELLPDELAYTDKTRDDGSPLRIDYEEDENPHPYYWLLMNGGAELFPVEQIIEHGWDVNPPYGLPREAFPQLTDDVIPVRWKCPRCTYVGNDRLAFLTEQNLANHLQVGHQMRDWDSVQAVIDRVRAEREALAQPS